MPFTESRWEQGSVSTDLQMFIGADQIRNTSGAPTLTLNGSGDLSLNLGASTTAVFAVSASDFLRTGQYAVPIYSGGAQNAGALPQQAFGTAASVPGPSTIAGTSDPLALPQGTPPQPSSKLATLGNIRTGPLVRGFQINSVDVIYLITGAALTSIAIGLTKTVFANNVANAVLNMIAKAQNGLATATQANPYVTNVVVPAPAMITSPDTATLLELDVTTAAGGAFRLYGFVLRMNYNLN